MNRILVPMAVAVALAATAPARAEVMFPTGSRVGLSPPQGFTPSESFRGFEEKQSGSAILTVELPGQAYGDIEKAMTTPALRKQGVIVEKRETVPLHSHTGPSSFEQKRCAFLFVGNSPIRPAVGAAPLHCPALHQKP